MPARLRVCFKAALRVTSHRRCRISMVIDEMKKALGEMLEVRALISTALWTLGSMLLIMAINPVAPALVAVIGVG